MALKVPPHERIMPVELGAILLPLLVSTITLLLPALVVGAAGRDAWISPWIAALYGAAVIAVATALHRRFPRMTVFEYSCRILGPVAGWVLGALYTWFFFSSGVIVLRELADLLVTTTLPRTPHAVLTGIELLLAGAAVRQGLRAIGRTNTLFAPLALLLFIAVFATAAPDAEPAHLQPLLEKGWTPVLQGAVLVQGFFGELILLSILLPRMSEPRQAGKVAYAVLGVSAAVFSLTNAATTAIFGEYTGHLVYPFFSAARASTAIQLAVRIDPLVIALWVVSISTKITVFLYAAVVGLSRLCRIADYRCFVFPLAALAGVLSIAWFEGSAFVRSFVMYVFPFYALLFELVIPLTLWALAASRGVRGAE
ncbi:MAG TPA: endospore germination permease [Limnochordia bacterium]